MLLVVGCEVPGVKNYLFTGFAVIGLSMSMTALSDNTKIHYLQFEPAQWRLITDGVMGGVSEGKTGLLQDGARHCIELSGNVRTENNGGFIQIAIDIDEQQAKLASQYAGILLEVKGNAEQYNLHLRTSDLWFPWQAYRATFDTASEWQSIKLPFQRFQSYKTGTPLNVEHLKRIGIVAIGREFAADICVSKLGFYSG
jgi:hypothetical protein